MTQTKKTTVRKKKPATPKARIKSQASSNAKRAGNVGVKKQYLKSRDICKVTFRLPSIAVPDAGSVSVVGEFNAWDVNANPMKKLKSGDFTTTIELTPGKKYQFRYLIDQSFWENDWNADQYVRSPYGDCDNSVIVL